jgi:hypothetical protein
LSDVEEMKMEKRKIVNVKQKDHEVDAVKEVEE